jgi:hypothetical protein
VIIDRAGIDRDPASAIGRTINDAAMKFADLGGPECEGSARRERPRCGVCSRPRQRRRALPPSRHFAHARSALEDRQDGDFAGR